MKIIRQSDDRLLPSFKKIWLIMKLNFVLILFAVLQVSASVSAQNTRLDLKMKNATISQVFDEIERQSGVYFFYNKTQIDENKIISVDYHNKSIDEVLKSIVSELNLTYEVAGKNIIIKAIYPSDNGFQQSNTKIKGTVKNANDESLPGVTVLVKGTTNGTITDVDGNYSLANVPANATLVFSFVGMKTKEIQVEGKETVNTILADETIGLDEVVAVGYGTQKKVNLTGAISAVSERDIKKLNVTQPSQLLAGLASGITVTQSSGQPGKDEATLRIRGLGTFSSAGTSPLVLVDGISSDLNNINASDIESISILKDAASAAIYGTRAANGVILIETKKGKEGVTKVTYQANFGFQRPSEIPKIVDSWVYAEMINEALQNAGSNLQYTEAEIAKFRSGEDPDNYANKRHYDDLVNSGNGFQNEHYLSFTGGNNKNSYLFSLGYLNQNGFIDKTNHKHYNVLFNESSKISDSFRINIKFQGRTGATTEPTTIRSGDGVDALLNYALKIPNTIAGKKSDGYYGQQTGFTIEGWMDSEAFIKSTSNRMNASAGFEWDILKSLKLTGLAGYNYDNTKYKRFWPTLVVDQTYTESPSELTETRTENSLLTLQSYINYNKIIGLHEFHVLGGFSQESNTNSWLQASRDNFPSNTLYEISAGAQSNMQNSGSGYEWALQSFFGRINYVFDGKYLIEANTRYDGSSRFPKNKRWGLFPSVSTGWIISQEKFFNVSSINNLKIRASWGKLGNQNIGNYPYQQILTLGINAPFGVSEKISSGTAATDVPSTDITWESTRVIDAGLDIGLFNNKINASIDIYDKRTSDILYNVTASSVLGMTPSVQNAGVVSNKGIDLNLQHQYKIGDFSYTISANFSYVKNEVKKLATVIRDVNSGLFVGSPLQSIYGYVADGLFVDQQDVNNYPTQPRVAAPGDIKLKDISGPDGVPDGKVNADYDRKIIGNQFPKYTYGLTISPRYKNFDLFVNLYGVGGVDKILGGFADNAFFQGSNPQEWMMDRWTKENPNPKAAYPRFLILGGSEQQFYQSTFVMQNASFLRVSNIQLGYTVPTTLVKKISISNVYVYINVKNPFTFDHFREGWDPEMGAGYPPARYFSAGINVNF